MTDCMYLLKPPAPTSLPQQLTSPRTATTTSLLLVLSCLSSPLQRFRPITVEQPKVLLPLVNAPLLEYTLEWLASNAVEEVS